MPIELTRAKEVMAVLEIHNKDLLLEYFESRNFQSRIDYLENGKKRDFWSLLEKNEKIIDELAKVWIFEKEDVADIFDDILKFYRENQNHDFCKIIEKLDKKQGFTSTEKVICISINDIHFFNKCYDMLSIHANNGVVYGVYEGKKDVEITLDIFIFRI